MVTACRLYSCDLWSLLLNPPVWAAYQNPASADMLPGELSDGWWPSLPLVGQPLRHRPLARRTGLTRCYRPCMELASARSESLGPGATPAYNPIPEGGRFNHHPEYPLLGLATDKGI